MAEISNYKVAASPHKLDSSSTRTVMLDVLIALIPCLVCGVVYFGLYSLALVVICMATCFLSEQLYNLIRKKPFTFDLSALVTGLILGLNLPPRAPWYIPIIGGVFAIIIVKMLFGGLGKNFANPAATARVFLLLAYGSVMTKYIGFDIAGNILSTDVVTAPTYLSGGTAVFQSSFMGVSGYWGYVLQLLFGTVGGSIGETCKIAVLAGGVYLGVRRVIDWRIPVVYLLTAAVMLLACYGSAKEVLLQLLSGGLLFGAVFMATDYATSPKWKYNRVLYAFGLGVITVLIRRFGSYPEGTSLAILIMNLLVPLMDKFILPVRFGQMTKAEKPMPQIMQWVMRSLCIVMAVLVLIFVPITNYTNVYIDKSGVYSYVQEVSRKLNGEYVFTVQGGAPIMGGYVQNLEYKVYVDAGKDTVTDVVPIAQSTMGYTAELSFFEGKTYEEILQRTDLSADGDFSATKTNTKLREMILECFSFYDYNMARYERLAYTDDAITLSERNGTLYRFTIAGVADLTEYNYKQSLKYAITLDSSTNTVYAITTLAESTFGYTCDKPVFLGKTKQEIAEMTRDEIASDITTGATITNVSVQGLIVRCFEVMDTLLEGTNG